MTKIYRCNKINEKGSVCNETDENNFRKGRYNTCKKCRLRVMSEYNKSKKEQKQNEDANKTDPDNHIRCLIEDTITRVPLINKKTIPCIIHKLELDITEECLIFDEKLKKFETNFEEKIKILVSKISTLEDENITLKLQMLNFKEYIRKTLNEKL
jgi:hypothetical protein